MEKEKVKEKEKSKLKISSTDNPRNILPPQKKVERNYEALCLKIKENKNFIFKIIFIFII